MNDTPTSYDEELAQILGCVRGSDVPDPDDIFFAPSDWVKLPDPVNGHGYLDCTEEVRRLQALLLRAQIDELEQRKGDYQEYYPRGSGSPYASQKCVPEAYLEARIAALQHQLKELEKNSE